MKRPKTGGPIRVERYESETQDFVTSAHQDYQLKADYTWVRKSPGARIAAKLSYGAALLIGACYNRFTLHVTYKNRKILKEAKRGGFFLYANHTQPFGDIFLPAFAAFPRRIYVLVSPANLGIPVIGKILPYLGALPLPSDLHGYGALRRAITQRLSQHAGIVIYPEAHVWPYCTKIRDYPDASFSFPVKEDKPVFAMTTTYQKRRFGKKPKTTVFLDGPFFPDPSLPQRDRSRALRDEVYRTMQARSAESTYEYIRYVKSSPS